MTTEEIIKEIDDNFGGNLSGFRNWRGELTQNPEKWDSINNIEDTLREVERNYKEEEGPPE